MKYSGAVDYLDKLRLSAYIGPQKNMIKSGTAIVNSNEIEKNRRKDPDVANAMVIGFKSR